MNKSWLIIIIAITLALLAVLKTHELRSLTPYFKPDKAIKLATFEEARGRVGKEDLDELKLWESILTGRSAPLSRLMKEKYAALGLNHLFTPSGFHLSAVLFPFLKFIKPSFHLYLLLTLGVSLCFLPGLIALKRMLLIKTNQKIFGLHIGFIVALILDVFFGSFQNGALSFTYSFLFLGIIYSGLEGIGLIIWFFLGQMILAYFQNSDLSILLLIFSPLMNLCFGIMMPILFLLSFPLWNWQLYVGIKLLSFAQELVDLFANLSEALPVMEIHVVMLIMIFCILFKKFKATIFLSIFLSSSLNLDRERASGMSSNEFVPQKEIVKTIYREKEVLVYFRDGKCRMRLVRGFWYENCSPRVKGSSRNKKLKRFSFLFEELRMSSLHG